MSARYLSIYLSIHLISMYGTFDLFYRGDVCCVDH